MQLRRFRLRTLLIAVAVVALAIGGLLEHIRLKRFADYCRSRAMGHGTNVQMRRSDLASAMLGVRRLKSSPNPDGSQIEMIYRDIELLRTKIALEANLVRTYEHAANHPWEGVPEVIHRTDDAVELSPLVSRFPANPNPPPYTNAPDPRPPEERSPF
jgi:hypothetical protein